ncbi:MAG TPA: type II toxin-antitoxin system prevent-host-death family antitoxin [Bryobacteraceae bacterium]|nr:type II toxin-antitoxin system prevent-host-death family antitoxin [Bryobacteraceae bacterium]
MPLTVNMHQAKSQLSRLVAQVHAGEEVWIARAGKPVARLTRLETRAQVRRLGTAKGKVRIAKDFDGPVPGFEEFYR